MRLSAGYISMASRSGPAISFLICWKCRQSLNMPPSRRRMLMCRHVLGPVGLDLYLIEVVDVERAAAVVLVQPVTGLSSVMP